ncbi:ATP-binding protein [Sphingomonas sp.]|uniref:ATP-binding protein n=1 Tax=Sphingomonas sp. TaxID=28214 RepID=UPI001EB85186|nr:ATP-binding protein [Sphingomonas sp.]MBX3593997.1 tetratricopeptide repeat protein [Sphingomonas sp.]
MLRGIALALATLCLGLAMPAAAQSGPAQADIDKAKAAMIGEPRDALALSLAAEKQAATIADPAARATASATALWLQGEALIRMRDAKAASPRIARALRLISGDPRPGKLKGDLLLARAGVQQDQLRPAEALASLQEAYTIFADVGEKRSQSITLQTIATLYTQANDLASADKYFRQASEVYEGDPKLSIFLLNNRGNVLLQLDRPAEAVAQYRRALKIARSLETEQILPQILINLGRAYLHDKDTANADAVLGQAQRLIDSGVAPGMEWKLLSVSAKLAFDRGRLDLAEARIARAFAGVRLADTTIAYRDAHLTAYEIYRARGETKQALAHLERVRNLGDEAAQLATSTNIALMAARFDYANQELRIANLKAEELRRAAEFQRTIFIGLGGATLIIITLLSIGLFTIRRSRNQVRAANTELNETNVALEKALKAKTEFLATTSHEIRTPLNGILGMTQIMLRDPSVPAATRDRLDVVHGAGMTMRALVDDILDVAKMETGNLSVELVATDLQATLRDAARMWQEQARGKGLEFRLDIDGAPNWVNTDPGRLRQMLFNLLSNAIKFTESGTIALTASAEGGRLCIAVTDSGIGIPAEKHEEIFESFKQVDAGTTRKFGGTGLGLAIVRNLARALGGDVAVRSDEGAGTCFTIDLPLDLAEAPGGDGVSGNARRIVVLDRNPIARGMLRTLLEPAFASVQFAGTPEEAVDLLDASTLLLAEEATLRAAGDDIGATVAGLASSAQARGAAVAVLWSKLDDDMRASLLSAKVGMIVEKPIAGAILIERLIGFAEENFPNLANSSLVSQAA